MRPISLRGFRRRHRWLLRLTIGIPLVLTMAFVLVTHSPITRRMIVDELAKQLGLLVTADAAYVALDGDLVMENATFRIPGVPGAAGQFLRVAHVEASVDWNGILSGGPDVKAVRLIDPTLIISQSTIDGQLNVGALKVPAASGSGALPAILVTHANIELGEHTGERYTMLRRTQMDGWYRPSSEGTSYAFRLHENTTRPRRPDGPPEPGFVITGDHSSNHLFVRVTNFSLDDWGGETVPSKVRGLLEDLYVRGNVPRAIFSYSPETGITAQLEAKGVAMNLPLDPTQYYSTFAEGVQGPLPQFVRMHDVNGTITFSRDTVSAEVDGLLEDLPYTVSLKYAGLTMESPFTLDFDSKNFNLRKNPGLLPYAPPKVRELLGLFSGPTAVVDTKMQISRRALPEGGVGPIEASGTVKLREGTAAYQKFPYAFENMTGEFTFDNDQVKIVEVRGRSKSGAVLKADGLIAPLDDTAEVRVNVDVKEAPIDEALQAAFGPGRQDLFPTLFNESHYRQLLDAGLIQTPEQAAAAADALASRERDLAQAAPEQAASLNADIAALRRRLQVPVFRFRGKADVLVNVLSPRGRDSGYKVGIDIRIPDAGIVPGKFPLPVHARDVRVVVENESGRLVSGTFSAVGGGDATVQAAFKVPNASETRSDPDVRITVRDIPCGPLLLNGLPGSSADSASDAGGKVKRILRDLGITGSLAGDVVIRPREEEPDRPIGLTADLKLKGGTISPGSQPGAAPMRLTEATADIHATERSVNAHVSGLPEGSTRPEEAGSVPTQPLVADISAAFGDRERNQEPSYRVHLVCPSLPLAAPVEDFIGVFSARAAAEVLRLREEYNPDGPLSLVTDAESVPGAESPRLTVEMKPLGDLTVALLGDRLVIKSPEGRAVLRSLDGVGLSVEGVAGPIAFADEPAGRMFADGKFPIVIGSSRGTDDRLTVRLSDARFECKLVDRVLAERLSPDGHQAYVARKPEGLFDAVFSVTKDGPTRNPGSESEMRVTAVFEPRTLTLHPGDTPVTFPAMTGQIEIDGGAGVLRSLHAEAKDWSITADGAWETSLDGAVSLRTQLSGSATSLTPDLRAILPGDLRDALGQLSFKVDGPLSMEESTLAITRGKQSAEDSTRFSGAFTFTNASLKAGVEISDLNGTLDSTYQSLPGGAAPQFSLDAAGAQFRVAGIWLTGGRAQIRSGARRGEIQIPQASGDCYAGRFNARADVVRSTKDDESPLRFNSSVQFAGVRLNPLLRDLSETLKDAPDHEPEGTPPTDAASREDFSRGLLDAEFSMTGLVDKSQSRRGRGTVRVQGGRVVNLPFITRLVEVSNLVLPANAGLDYARANFYLEGGRFTFPDVSVYSEAVQILGYGTMTWPGQILDLRFNSRSARPIPILSTIVQGIRDELVSTHVTGKLGEQRFELEQFPGTRRMLGRAVGAPQSEQARRMNEIERLSGERSGPARSDSPVAPSQAGSEVQVPETTPEDRGDR